MTRHLLAILNAIGSQAAWITLLCVLVMAAERFLPLDKATGP